MDKKYIVEIANIIRTQLTATTPANVLMSWGILKMYATVHDNMPSLALVVTGRLYKGIVIIAYNEGADYYELFLENKEGKYERVAYDLDFNQLGETIDTHIEKGEDEKEYNEFCKTQRLF